MSRQGELFEFEKPLSSDSVLKYVGGKFFWRDSIVRFVPEGVREVVSPFVGGGHLEVMLSGMGMRLICGDIYKPLVCAWKVLLEEPELIASRIERHVPTRDNHIEIRRAFFAAEESDSDWRELGVLFYMTLMVSFNGIIGKRTPTGSLAGKDAVARMKPALRAAKVRAFHAPRLSVELSDYRRLLSAHPGVFSYMDPPYKIPYALYGSDGETHEGFDHDDYADFVLARKAPWIISYNDDEWIRDRYRDRRIITLRGRYSCLGKSKEVEEVLILSGIPDGLADRVERELGAAPPALVETGELF